MLFITRPKLFLLSHLSLCDGSYSISPLQANYRFIVDHNTCLTDGFADTLQVLVE